MNFKKIGLMLSALLVTVGLAGCSGSKLPEGDVKIVKQDINGVIGLLLESADYGQDQSTVASMVLPEGSSYDINLSVEQYENGQLVNTLELPTYTTATMDKNGIVHMILNIGESDIKTIYSIAEVDTEKTTDSKNPQYKVTKMNEAPMTFDARTEIGQYGGDLNTPVALAGYVTFKERGTQEGINLTSYTDEVGNYASANIVKVNIVQK
ncbi:hypothetical protein [Turicibacter sanguinis]|uniref:Uncharacterized protein n=1 Tax=Turicibacter sanguinis TaxID=154288 RepID=A0A6G2CQQ9_9FIRM|nr:hypothetical protein [Turicibacter sanguinis]MTK70873.1 hypothetical protein [Turicibacter sanguinis]MTK81965.1 hypothetical protein [Turicibacter sanguinis]MTK84515.1 hypothetical protein [Turicibacter sanguinis]MTK87062.1 hypothetical protein [Turicibacter sanguinis]MTK95954.1 hypothetical protein [Turicibacter sanguinis]